LNGRLDSLCNLWPIMRNVWYEKPNIPQEDYKYNSYFIEYEDKCDILWFFEELDHNLIKRIKEIKKYYMNIELTDKEKEQLILEFEECCTICICDMLENINYYENDKFKEIYDKLNKHCEENRLDKKSCNKCFKSFFSLFTEEKDIIF